MQIAEEQQREAERSVIAIVQAGEMYAHELE